MNIDKIKSKLFSCVLETEIGSEIVDILVPRGKPHSFETELWDYMRILEYFTTHSDNTLPLILAYFTTQ